MAIDNELDAIHRQYPDPIKNPIFEATCAAVSTVHPMLGLVNALRQHFSRAEAETRVRALLDGLESVVRQHGCEITTLRAKFEQPSFVETWIAAAEQAIRTASLRRIRRFAAILGAELVSNDGNEQSWQDAAAFIRDIAELSDADVEALRILDIAQNDIFTGTRKWSLSFECSKRKAAVLAAVDSAGMNREDFFSRCLRLSGFGLALMIQEPDAGMVVAPNGEPVTYGPQTSEPSPEDMGFRMTERGRKLISMVKNSD
jgi:hypothetical protein